MPIEVFTGVPGAGKTLRMLEEVEERGRKDQRTVYYNGIKDLAIDGWIEFADAEKWYELPQGSIIVIDEAQRVFRPSHFAKEVPLFLSELETHRHKGFDIYMTTQRIMLLHSNLRGLIGRHVHVNRRFGTNRATLLEFPRAVEQPQAKQDDAVRHEWSYPTKVFEWYKSAEVHTIKRRIPAKLYLLLLLPFIIGGLVWYAWSRQSARMNGETNGPIDSKGLPRSAVGSPAGGPGRSPTLSTADWLAARQPRLGGLQYTAAAYDEVTKPVRAPVPSACVASKNRCQCYTDQATKLPMPEDLCRRIAAEGFYVDFGAASASVSRPPIMEGAAQPAAPAAAPPAVAGGTFSIPIQTATSKGPSVGPLSTHPATWGGITMPH